MITFIVTLITVSIIVGIVAFLIHIDAKAKERAYDKYEYMVGKAINPDFPDEVITRETFETAKKVMRVLSRSGFDFIMVPDGTEIIIESTDTRAILTVNTSSVGGFIKQTGYRMESAKSENCIEIRLTFSMNPKWRIKLYNVIRAAMYDVLPSQTSNS